MTWLRGRGLPLTVLVAAMSILVASVVLAARGIGGGPSGPTMMGPGAGMMAPAVPGDGPVRTLDDAGRAAGRLAERWGLEVGEVMQFDNGFYAELVDPAGEAATEVLIDPGRGAVQVEWGPAMMWNTTFGTPMARGYDVGPVIGPEQARRAADQWLRDNRPGEHADEPEAFPGYYTLHTLRGDQIVGMLSVHATTGAVWYHSWHGRFVAMSGHSDHE
ncbi:hypothetical protein [Rhodococcus ruber]|uniref:hypothetical protein n=1 Tax=Rhodococcus ruber TaxID=1830 RepID=UPI000E6AF9C2|nr:hypothetical protein [Rhodococcus ruber]AXY49206.1 hypothetical protein YT1_p10005 [Rhodococcus ruber]